MVICVFGKCLGNSEGFMSDYFIQIFLKLAGGIFPGLQTSNL